MLVSQKEKLNRSIQKLPFQKEDNYKRLAQLLITNIHFLTSKIKKRVTLLIILYPYPEQVKDTVVLQ